MLFKKTFNRLLSHSVGSDFQVQASSGGYMRVVGKDVN